MSTTPAKRKSQLIIRNQKPIPVTLRVDISTALKLKLLREKADKHNLNLDKTLENALVALIASYNKELAALETPENSTEPAKVKREKKPKEPAEPAKPAPELSPADKAESSAAVSQM